ncbi:hypothetical protein [Selenomonas sp. AE3005]|uniref:hypothetical protein n=1 Tax=Selenomonas sp. AE3005 TaxID=1485543 RepID=UPI0025F46D85|nr:hypothetical protein [Selenomonas sp. AE3005]
MTEQDAQRVVERAEGLYQRAVKYTRDKSHAAELRLKAQSDAKLIGVILGKSTFDIEKELHENG